MHSPARQTGFQRRDHANDYGRSERITGATWTRVVDVEIDSQSAWAAVVDTQQISGDGAGGAVTARVLAKVEQGSGNGVSTTIVDATDLAIVPIAGDHVIVSLRLVSAFSYSGSAEGIIVPSPAPAAAAALVSCYLASDLSLQPMPAPGGPSFHVVPAFGAENISGVSTGTAALIATGPVRVLSYSATNPGAATAYLALVSQGTLPLGTSTFPAATVIDCIAIPAKQTVSWRYSGPRAAPAGLAWLSSSALDPVALAVDTPLRVDLELLRRPTTLVASTIAPTS